jgi:glucokinase
MAIGEAIFGEATTFRSNGTIMFLFLDAGVGGALLSNGSIHHGANWSGSEFGQISMTMDPYARRGPGGSIGTLEAYCSTSGLVHTWQELTGNCDSRITAEDILADARSNSKGAAAIAIAKTGEYLGYGLASLSCMINPHAIIIGGELSNLGEDLLNPARQILQQRNIPKSTACSISTAKLGSHAAIIGAASLVMLKIGILETTT